MTNDRRNYPLHQGWADAEFSIMCSRDAQLYSLEPVFVQILANDPGFMSALPPRDRAIMRGWADRLRRERVTA